MAQYRLKPGHAKSASYQMGVITFAPVLVRLFHAVNQ